MTSKFSASASEIFAGAIQDYGRGIVVGDPATHGKGSVQTLMDLAQQIRLNRANFGALKVTLQQFYLPDGQSTQLKGVNADVLLPSVTAKMDISEGDLKFALKHDTVTAAGSRTIQHGARRPVGIDCANVRPIESQRIKSLTNC